MSACPHCGAALAAAQGIAHCTSCDGLSAAAPVDLAAPPPGLRIVAGDFPSDAAAYRAAESATPELVIEHRAVGASRWLGLIIFVLIILFVVAAWTVEIIWLGSTTLAVLLYLGCLVLLWFGWYALARAFTRTTIRVTDEHIDVSNGPFSLFLGAFSPRESLVELWAARSGQRLVGRYQVRGLFRGGLSETREWIRPAVRGLHSAEQALWLEAALRARLQLPKSDVRAHINSAGHEDIRRSPTVGHLVAALAGMLVLGVLPAVAIIGHGGEELGSVPLGSEPRDVTIRVPDGKPHIAFYVDVEIEGAGGSTRTPLPHVFDVHIQLLKGGTQLHQLNCDGSKHHVFKHNERSFGDARAEFRLDDCHLELAPGSYVVRARRVTGPEHDPHTVTRAVLTPNAYESRTASRD